MWRRGSAPLPTETDNLLLAARRRSPRRREVARAGYREASTQENALFNLLASFVDLPGGPRRSPTCCANGGASGPFRNLRVGRRHIHHFVPGIVLAFVSGAAAIVTRDEDLEPMLAVPFGVGWG